VFGKDRWMQWKFPACSTPSRQQLTATGVDTPRPGVDYRCSVCRLELILDPTTDELITRSFTAWQAANRPQLRAPLGK